MSEKQPTYNICIGLEKIEKALSHAVNYCGLDSKLNTTDYNLAKKLGNYVLDHLLERTESQIYESMSEMDRLLIGNPEYEQYLKNKYYL